VATNNQKMARAGRLSTLACKPLAEGFKAQTRY
jgi:hypothetical protein